ncbi:MAG: PKD domain-containing protein, partial [Candidatus Aminicenantes bacterium]|nr:PKD domain-containing protein [Candidatus Aminicenantes bacterium]
VTFVPAQPNVEQTVTFTITDVYPILSGMGMGWTFGDGATFKGNSPITTHAYLKAGTYTVRVDYWVQPAVGGLIARTSQTMVTVSERRRVTFTPASPLVNQTVTFRAENFLSSSVRWDFGDGTSPTTSGPTVTHAFSQPGTYTVRAYDNGGVSTIAISATVAVGIDTSLRRIVVTPASPEVGQPAAFQAVNFFTKEVRWDFGDGSSPVNGSTAMTHAFSIPGSYIVRAWDWYGAVGGPTSVTVSVVINPARRQVAWTPRRPAVGRPVAFEAVNFYTTEVRWDFGDGTPPVDAGPAVTHAFGRAGTFTVRAWDWRGKYAPPVTAAVLVGETAGPRAAFQISFLRLRFDDGQPYKVVAKNTPGLRAFADIKFEGTGILQVQWLVDGMPLPVQARTLSFARTELIDSGRVPGLPTELAGPHDVSLRILSPETDFEVPVIRYFVTAGRVVPGGPLRVALELTAAAGLDGRAVPLTGEAVQMPPGEYCVLSGRVRNLDQAEVTTGLLRVTVDGGPVDIQVVRGLRPGEVRPFVTSIFRPRAAGRGRPREAFLAFYDISTPIPVLLVAKKIVIVQAEEAANE